MSVLHPLAPGRGVVVPLKRFDVGADDVGEGVDEMGAQAGVHILGVELAHTRAVLGPVGVVAHTPLGG